VRLRTVARLIEVAHPKTLAGFVEQRPVGPNRQRYRPVAKGGCTGPALQHSINRVAEIATQVIARYRGKRPDDGYDCLDQGTRHIYRAERLFMLVFAVP
jgi:hypothetical protein